MKFINVALTLTFAVLTCTTISCSNNDYAEHHLISGGKTDTNVLLAARQVVEAFNSQNGKKLASLVHPKKGVRFSASAFVDIKSDVVFSKTQIETFWTDEKRYTWGFSDSTGDPINMTPNQYCREYIMNRNFLSPSSIYVNRDRGVGNTKNNAALVYPNGTRVEYYIEPSGDDMSALNWAALRLVFERNRETWFLIAVIHDEWSI